MLPILHTIPVSHYAERARWALDVAEIDYQERQHLQAFAWGAAYAIGRQKTLPILVHEGGTIKDSRAIVEWAATRSEKGAALYPESGDLRTQIDRWSEDFAGAYGIAARQFAYAWLPYAGRLVLPIVAGRAPGWQVAAMSALFGPALAFASRYFESGEAALATSISVIDRTLDQVGASLRDGRRYLVGDRFTAADLTFAAMSAPWLLPARYGVPLPTLDLLPADAQREVNRWRAHPAGAFALRLYDERPVPRGTYKRTMRVAPRAEGFPP